MKRSIRPSKTADSLREEIRGKVQEERKEIIKEKKPTDVKDWVSSGCILFNLACSDRWYGAYKIGTMINIVGDSSSGKSILVLSGMAAIANNPAFDEYRLIYDDAEFADSFDHLKLFGQNFVDRIEPPGEENSSTIEQFFDHIMDAVDDGRPFIYCLDSFDAIDADAEIEKEQDNRKHRKEGNLSKIKGSFQATKQKKASQMFRQICSKLKQTRSILIIISQTRDNLAAMSFSTKYRAGGKALKFYASIEAWLAYKGGLDKTYQGVKHKIGVQTIAKLEKNKFTGKRKEAEFPIYYDYGIDDITSCVDFLILNKWWVLKKQTVLAEEFNQEMTKPKLIEYIEQNHLDKKLFKITQQCWDRIENSLKLNRRSKYDPA